MFVCRIPIRGQSVLLLLVVGSRTSQVKSSQVKSSRKSDDGSRAIFPCWGNGERGGRGAPPEAAPEARRCAGESTPVAVTPPSTTLAERKRRGGMQRAPSQSFFVPNSPPPQGVAPVETREDTRECKNGSRNLGAACLRELEFGTFLVGVAAWSELGVWRFVPLKRRGPRSLFAPDSVSYQTNLAT